MLFFKKKTPIDWNLNYEMLAWIDKYLRQYKEKAGKVVDLTYHTFCVDGEEYTQIELIDEVLDRVVLMLDDFYFTEDEEELNKNKDFIFDALKEMFWALWW